MSCNVTSRIVLDKFCHRKILDMTILCAVQISYGIEHDICLSYPLSIVITTFISKFFLFQILAWKTTWRHVLIFSMSNVSTWASKWLDYEFEKNCFFWMTSNFMIRQKTRSIFELTRSYFYDENRQSTLHGTSSSYYWGLWQLFETYQIIFTILMYW